MRRFLLLHRLGFRREAPVRQMMELRYVLGHRLGFCARCFGRFRHSGALGDLLREQVGTYDGEQAAQT